MPANAQIYNTLSKELEEKQVTLIAVSKKKSVQEILELYNFGQRDFGENYVQELVEKREVLPEDIRWHFIGHLQTNKVKEVSSFIHLIHSVDSLKLLKEINKQAIKNNSVTACLLQVHIASEESKFGFNEEELQEAIDQFLNTEFYNVKINGLMGMASFSSDQEAIKMEFNSLKLLFEKYSKIKTTNFDLTILSMGMSSDYKIAIDEGSNMVRIGSLIFGARD